jgi:methionyl-tRNA formyltransferase
MGLNVLIAGQEAAGARILRALSASAHRVVAVLTEEPKATAQLASLSAHAAEAGLTTLPAKLVKDASFAERVREWQVDLLLNVHSLHIVADAVLAAPRIGAFNLHPGPLPSYAGLHTPGWAIYNGESEYGVTVHWMEPGIDTGPIAYEERFPVPARVTALGLAAECTRRGVALLHRLIQCAEDDPSSIPRAPQDLAARTYYARQRIPEDGKVDWNRPAAEVARFARAFDYGPFASPWGRPLAVIGGRRVGVLGIEPTGVVTDAAAGSHRFENGLLQLACSDEWVDVRHVFVDGALMERDRVAEWIGAGVVDDARSSERPVTPLGANI